MKRTYEYSTLITLPETWLPFGLDNVPWEHVERSVIGFLRAAEAEVGRTLPAYVELPGLSVQSLLQARASGEPVRHGVRILLRWRDAGVRAHRTSSRPGRDVGLWNCWQSSGTWMLTPGELYVDYCRGEEPVDAVCLGRLRATICSLCGVDAASVQVFVPGEREREVA